MKNAAVIVIGSGIAGTTFAHRCARAGMSVLVLEKDAEPGGALRSHRFAKGDGFWAELGAHTCYNSYNTLLTVIEECGLLAELQPRAKVGFKFLVANRVRSIVSQLHLLEAAWRLPFGIRASKAGLSVADYYTRLLGPKNYADVLSPAFNAVMCQSAGDLPADMLFKKRPRRADVQRTYSLPRGLQQIVTTALAQPGITLLTNCEVVGIERGKAGLEVATATGELYQARQLVVATPANVAAQLLRQAFPSVSEKLSRIRVEVIETVGVLVPRAAVNVPPVAGLIARDDLFYSAVSRDVLPHPTWRGFAFHFKPGKLDAESKLRRIADALGVATTEIVESVFRANVLPSPKLGHAELVGSLDATLAGLPLFLVGNYFDGVSIEECAARAVTEFTRLTSSK
ncbi:MAG: FAD-dependent oxidoreductase [Chloracidobacterium sp.]|uniref:FAD-dependent oxidoreductase n=1 Tax=Chloracidobacterium validum TaxID=2821543 RepID=A0ABX8BCP2_9BACT|nr:FAD-dependent oxidoreductase [Chloracidobacterium validum]QUW04456.1 FAD-dependent oxidoreductase [Chloracidobacterium validum]